MPYQFSFSVLVEANLFDSIFPSIQEVQSLHRNTLHEKKKAKQKTDA